MTATKVAVISGAAQGIGRRTAELLATRGYALALADLQGMSETIASIRKAGGEVLDLQGDLTGEAFVEELAAAVRERFGHADVLVNNAGISFISRSETVSAADYRRVLEVNLVAPFLLARAFGTMMLARK